MNQSLFNRWKNAMDQTKQNNLALSVSNNFQNERRKIIQSQIQVDNHENVKLSVSKQQKIKGSRMQSNDSKKNISSKDHKNQQNKKSQTPVKKLNKKNDKHLDNCLNAILQLHQIGNQEKIRSKVKSLLEDLLLNVLPTQWNVQNQKSSKIKQSIMMTSQHEREYSDLESKYFESEKQRHYLKGKSQMIVKKYEGLQRELQRYNKMQKLIQNCISREAELKQQISRLKNQKQELQFKMNQQKEIFSRQLNNVHLLVQSLKTFLPTS